ncbi:MAG: arsenic resistance N-acetyltransferase ArsN2 [Candidatus Zixiibacteriota bacterium]
MTKATCGNIALVKKMLSDNGLPGQDIDDKIECLFLAYHDSELVGIGGLEIHGQYGLLRSLVTLVKFRGGGYGKIITRMLLERAADNGLSEVYLLTTTAAKFFEKMGFAYIERSSVPESIAGTTEFTSLCPASAICMMKRLSI